MILQPIAYISDGFDDVAIAAQLLPQGADMHIHSPGFSRIFCIPNGGEQLLSAVWNTEYVGETRTVDMHIRTLRQKLGQYGHIIETVRNVGYRLENKHDK